MKWNSQQESALKKIEEWYKDPESKQWFFLSGLAGTGKTTLARHIVDTLTGDAAFIAFTGKAALVMRQNGCYGASTCHSLLYHPKVDPVTGDISFVKKNEDVNIDLIVLDECSMIDDEMAQDILELKVKILVLGDPGQLPPIKGKGFFIHGDPDFLLTEIHRQAKDSPIIYLADLARRGLEIKPGKYGNCEVLSKNSFSKMLEVDQVIVGMNKTRHAVNRRYRRHLELDSPDVMPGDKIICLKNDHKMGIYNGELFDTQGVSIRGNDWYSLLIKSLDQGNTHTCRSHRSMFNDDFPRPSWKVLKDTHEFDYGYGITCHKSQGSQWDSIYVVDESGAFREDSQKWLYTAITRARDKIILTI